MLKYLADYITFPVSADFAEFQAQTKAFFYTSANLSFHVLASDCRSSHSAVLAFTLTHLATLPRLSPFPHCLPLTPLPGARCIFSRCHEETLLSKSPSPGPRKGHAKKRSCEDASSVFFPIQIFFLSSLGQLSGAQRDSRRPGSLRSNPADSGLSDMEGLHWSTLTQTSYWSVTTTASLAHVCIFHPYLLVLTFSSSSNSVFVSLPLLFQ